MASRSKNYDDFGELYEDITLGINSYDFDHLQHDPRLLMLLEFFRHFYKRRKEVLKRVFPKSITDEMFQIFEKMNHLLFVRRTKKMGECTTLTRSLSVGSQRPRSLAEDGELLRPERFKIRTIVPAGSTSSTSSGNGKSDTKSK
ncbi:hypothetical protein M5689_001581 [Euphorbia peplus]|nr:hypothetical protein M5689_001581 [Euphorbia peplus]